MLHSGCFPIIPSVRNLNGMKQKMFVNQKMTIKKENIIYSAELINVPASIIVCSLT